MTSWKAFSQQAPELAEFGRARFQCDGFSGMSAANAGTQGEAQGANTPQGVDTRQGVAYLATVRADGGPRVHPVTPILGEELFLFMEPTSPKGKDLQRDPRYSLHCAVEDAGGGGGEFYVRGRARLVQDPRLREQAVRAAPYTPRDDYILFVLSVEFAFMNRYVDGQAQPKRWRAE